MRDLGPQTRRRRLGRDHDDNDQSGNPLSELEWLSAEDAEFLADAVETIARAAAINAVAEQSGAERAYASSIANPNATPAPGPPPPYTIELECRPRDVIATCITPPTAPATFDCLRSVNGGATFVSMLYEKVVMAAGLRQAQGATFMWEIPLTRTLVNPHTVDAYPMQMRPGDIIQLTITGGAGIGNLSMQLRVQRVYEHVRRGRARL
jgi:hypothetical protein